MMRDDRHLHMLLMGCKGSADMAQPASPCSSELREEQILARKITRLMKTIKEQINAAASVK